MSIRAIVVDDSLLVREGVVRLLELSDAVEVVAECSNGDDALAAVDLGGADVVLTDIRMPPTHRSEGIELAHALRQTHPGIGVVVLSQHLSPVYAMRLLDEGSAGRGYLLKDHLSDPGELAQALVTVAEGGCHIDPLVVDALTARATTGGSARLEVLTAREREILADVAEGSSNRTIAERRVLVLSTVEKHVSSIFQKLGLADEAGVDRRVRAALVYLAAETP